MADRRLYAAPQLVPLTYVSVDKHVVPDIGTDDGFGAEYDPRALMAEFGSPLFIVSERHLRERFRVFLDTFSDAGVETRVAYSYKTNYLSAICSILHQEGAWAEVVSGVELSLAEHLKMPGKQIIFNGPLKRKAELEKAFALGATVNVDNFDELAMVEAVVSATDTPTKIGVRVNFREGTNPWTKFGFNYENGAVDEALRRIAAHPNLDLDLVHNHCGTFMLRHEVYGRSTEVLIDVARRARALGLAPTKIDIGGGFPSSNRLKPEFDFPGGTNWRDDMYLPYAEAVLSRLTKAGDAFGGRPTLILEPGRAIVDAAVQLLSSVVAVKDIPGQGKAVVIDAGVNLVPTAYWYDHAVKKPQCDAGKPEDATTETVNVYGPLCMQIDVVRERTALPKLELGQPLVVGNVGAYCHTQSMQFIQARPATVLLGADGPELIQRAETWKDFFQRDLVPKRLAAHGR
jgi:diaminopimelate decarboxylase